MTLLAWSPFPDADVRLAVFAAFFLIALGAALGLMVGYEDQGVAGAAQEHYGRSVVNTTYTAVAEQVNAQAISPWVAIGAFVAIILVNNLVTTALAAFNSRFLSMPLAVVVTSYMLASSGFIPAMIGIRVAMQYGVVPALAALAPHGIIEIVAMALAGAVGLLAATAPATDEVKGRVVTVYLRRIAPLVVVAAVIECIVTPVLIVLAL